MNIIQTIAKNPKVIKSMMIMDKNSPAMLVGAGITTMIFGGYELVKKTLTVQEDISPEVTKIVEIKEEDENTSVIHNKDLQKAYLDLGLKVTKIYSLPTFYFATSVGSFILSNHIITGRYKDALVAYASVSTAYASYRQRVKERFGEEVEKELYYNIRKEEFVTTDEDGNTITEEKTIVADPNSIGGPFTYIFERNNPNWEVSDHLKLAFFRTQENYFNYKLRTEKYVFLNDILEYCGFPKTKLGYRYGWVYPEGEINADDAIKFGDYFKTIFENGRGTTVLNKTYTEDGQEIVILDFNVQGDIYDVLED